jgi:uncharacterized membrane protein YtjA (UPF0391 family)
MIKWAIIFLVAAGIMALLGFGGLAGAFVDIAQILFFLAIAIFVILLVLGLIAGKKAKDVIDRH